MAHTTPHVKSGILTLEDKTRQQSITVGSAAWWHWLENAATRTFYFAHGSSTFTARCEDKNGRRYWYAYRKHHGKLHKAYLGKTNDLSNTHLEAIANQLANLISTTSATADTLRHKTRFNQLSRLQLPVLLNTKLHPPLVRHDLVSRPHLNKELDASLDKPLILLSAPAGFGKTTLLSSWIRTRSQHYACTWLSLDSGDNDVTRFWTYMVAALRPSIPGFEAQALPILQTQPELPIETLPTTLINALSETHRETLLVIDDLHVITEPAILQTLSYLLEHIPPHLHLIIASRGEPQLPLTRLRAQGRLKELRTADLRFTPAEINSFLKQIMNLKLSEQQIAALDAHTEGWIAGLQLAGLSMQGRSDITNFLASFTGSHRYILDYLTAEVLQRQPEHVQSFLLQTSILERLSAPLCNELTMRNDSQDILEYLEHANLFLIPLDEQRQWYRYHHLFADFLHNRLQQSHPELLPALHRRAAQWYEHYGLMSVTMEHAFASGDLRYTTCLAERFAIPMTARGEVMGFLRWLERLPTELIKSHLHLYIYFAGAYVAINRLDIAAELLHDIEQRLATAKDATTGDLAAYQKLEGEFLTVSTILASYKGDYVRTQALAEQVMAHPAAGDIFLRSLVISATAALYLFNGDLAKAAQTFEEAITTSLAAHNYHAGLASYGSQGYIQAVQGHLRRAAETYKETIRLGTRQGGQFFSVVSLAYAGLSDLYFEWNQLDEALHYAEEGLRLGRHWGYINPLALCQTIQARIYLVRKDITTARTLIREALSQASQYQLVPVTAELSSCLALIELHAGNDAVVEQWASTAHAREPDQLTHFRDLELPMLAFIDLCQGRLAQAQHVLTGLIPHAEQSGEQRILIDCLITQALLYARQEQLDSAITFLVRALTLAEPEGYMRTFLEKGTALAQLLPQALQRGITPRYTHALLTAFEAEQAMSIAPARLDLSERELSILRSMAAGKSNQEIAQTHIIALSTVKTHLNHIYTKLGVHSRTQAIARAKALDLL